MKDEDREWVELRLACVHEAAHEIVVMAYGGQGQSRVWRNKSAGAVAGEERLWAGQFLMYASPGAVQWTSERRELFGIEPAVPSNWRVLVGMAGLVGESMEEGERTAAGVFARILCEITRGSASETDQALMGERWTNRDVAKVMRLLRRRWDRLQRRAAELQADALDEHLA
ncbi:hypothetical protein [uncultured Pseudacidovorax sp.]|uniref:hypothetical protein n=1 Tax=uncultured Pseudacidovorax sp. TaxID=679313 RepID=UPI0025F25904|nr:hypothetical protein [uncultured Pseudacidovorax sp.]